MASYADHESSANDKRSTKKDNTPYDDVFRTLINDCRPLLFPLLNEIFGEHYTGEEPMIPSPNEHFLNQQDGNEVKRITDSSLTILADTVKHYLFECQTQPDSSMLIRIFEYATQIALDEGEIVQDTLKVTIPHSAILYLRSYHSTPDKLQIEITTPGGTVSFDVLITKIKDYSLDEIFEKNLLFLIPFYIFHYEGKSQLEELERSPGKLEQLKEELSVIVNHLEELVTQKKLDLYYCKTLLNMSDKVIKNLVSGYDTIMEGVKSVMGGTVLEYEAKTIYREGIIKGYHDGEAAGKATGFRSGEAAGFRNGEMSAKLESIQELMHNLKLTAEQAMQAIGIPVEDQAAYQEKLKSL
ncbi:MAG: hypothetical protein LUF92_16505 [Clostridiales bacterium]|nr:hypothetical protein [Clostridiales bacterium]